ncbi:hypothetical protein [Marinicella litoralis]|uniref:Uncharacterized protein n=1 Tax=Marinicella litoralis TaxID=644220 RepID=A0A4R6XBZ9_9GAMM|nr:hypothetical protein [Marinicella litoralis]TDR16795.1 hypothetical protein C8D91_2701 [Marinicella litoralis]
MSRKSLVLFALALFALALYAAGFKTGTFVLFAAAVVVESWFWFKFLKSRQSKKSKMD